MFMGYPLSQLYSVGVYMVGVIILFVVISLFSVWLDNKLFTNKNKLCATKDKK